MGRVIAIVGLPASGKTYYARQLETQNPGSILIDDPRNWEEIRTVIAGFKTKTFIITDPWLCLDRNRVLAESKLNKLGFKVEWIFFENDPQACKANDYRRETNSISDISWFSSQYTIPENAKVIPVWKSQDNQ